ncbi:MBL fold metallo-hydrolase [Hymenobacter perfusus]|uniref:3',5'-cyclic-nucleotide phosphodiesterase n=1 Tax=Hymenobacter perfusus TaxID=1236770 RepID=A0A428K7T1_9BACT|nr:3',5'-cyclic-nucleotide phosphodiesterase [Hymenobacter perfusus]RSK42527.1 3',5'-cyclic-nucleotide phosphodiesterase [Hymenobacter perfusus]
MYKLLLLAIICSCISAQAQPAFTVIPLGVKGGLAEGNLSAYLVAAAGSGAYVCLDAGTVYGGVEKAVAGNALPGPATETIRASIKGYLISHAHLDHVAGLLLNAPDDAPKPIYGLPTCLATLQNDYFNWRAWPNFGPAGNPPALGKYQLREMRPGREVALDNTPLQVQTFVLSHGRPFQSAAFLVRHGRSYLLYLGDTGADAVEQTDHLRQLWQAVAPLVRAGQLKAVFMEASYPNAQPEKQLFGHLTPALLLRELTVLSQLAGPGAVRGLPVVITHLKPTAGNEETIRRELAEGNTLQLRLIFPEQGQRLEF